MAEDSTFHIRPVNSFSERCGAWHLVYKKYLDAGFIKPHPAALHFSLLDLLPSSVTWLLFADSTEQQIAGTISGVMYSTAGLPCGLQYETELKQFGIDGRNVCEFTKLAFDDEAMMSITSSLEVAGCLIHWCWSTHIDDLICVCHPKHARTYAAVFGWREIGEVRGHTGVNGNPGILMHSDLKRYNSDLANLPSRGRKIIERVGSTQKVSKNFFRISGTQAAVLLMERSDLIYNSSHNHRAIVEKHYPWASRLISPLLYSSILGWEGATDLPRRRPNREVSIRPDCDAFNKNVDPLFVNHEHLALVIEPIHRDRNWIWESLEEANFIPVFANSFEEALSLVKESLFEIVIVNHKMSGEELNQLSNIIRLGDSLLRMHTGIFNFSDFSRLVSPSIRNYPNQENWTIEARCAREFASALRLIYGGESINDPIANVVNG